MMTMIVRVYYIVSILTPIYSHQRTDCVFHVLKSSIRFDCSSKNRCEHCHVVQATQESAIITPKLDYLADRIYKACTIAVGTATCLLSVTTALTDVLHSAHYQQMRAVHVSADVSALVDNVLHSADSH